MAHVPDDVTAGLTHPVGLQSCPSPLAAESGFVPGMAFPFVKLFASSPGGPPPEALFEVLATLLTNWARGWFDRFPHPPVGLLVRMQV